MQSRKAKSRQPPIAERKALRRHRGPRSGPLSVRCSVYHRGHASEFDLKRTCSRELKSSWHCLAMIDSVWAAFVEVGAHPDQKTGLGVPFRRWRCSPPVVKCAPFISPTWSSQDETEAPKRLRRLQNLGSRRPCCKASHPRFKATTDKRWPLPRTIIFAGGAWACLPCRTWHQN